MSTSAQRNREYRRRRREGALCVTVELRAEWIDLLEVLSAPGTEIIDATSAHAALVRLLESLDANVDRMRDASRSLSPTCARIES